MSKKLLFVCTGNTCRSPLAEALTRSLLEERDGWSVASAGLAAAEKAGATAGAGEAAACLGLDLSAHAARQLTPSMLSDADLVLAMTAHQVQSLRKLFPHLAAKIHTIKEYLDSQGDVSDPFGGSSEIYRATALELQELCTKLTEKLRECGG